MWNVSFAGYGLTGCATGLREESQGTRLNPNNLPDVADSGDLQGCACTLHQGGVEVAGHCAAAHVQGRHVGELREPAFLG